MRWIRQHIVLANVILVVIEAIVAYGVWLSGDWFFSGSKVTFGSLHSYIFIWLSIVIASIAALNSIFHSTLASDTQRPFLSTLWGKVTPVETASHITLPFYIHNSGSLPGDNVDIEIDFFDETEEVKEDNKSSIFPQATKSATLSMIFPNSSVCQQYIFDKKDRNDLKLWGKFMKGEVKIRFRIHYTSLGRKRLTIETERISKPAWEETPIFEPIEPLIWK